MKVLRLALLVAAVSLPALASAGELVLSFNDGRVTLKATEVSLRQILTEWARLGQTRIVGLEKLLGGPLTLELIDIPEKQALETLLRTVAGYAAAPRRNGPVATLSRFDRLMILPTSVASAAPVGGPRPAAFAPPPPSQFPDPIQLANEEPAQHDGQGPPVPVFNPNAEPPPMPVPVTPGQLGPGQLRPPGEEDPSTATPAAPAPLVAPRPGILPLPQPTPRP